MFVFFIFLAYALFFQMSSPVSATKFIAAGTLLCSTMDKPEPVPMASAKVQMWENDENLNFFDANDLLAEQQTTADGSFHLEGEQSELGEEEPYLYVEHKCEPKSWYYPGSKSDTLLYSKIDLLQLYKDIGQDTSHGDVWTVTDLKIELGDNKATAGGKEHFVETDVKE